MKVKITDLFSEIEIKNRGIRLDVYSSSGEERLGSLTITRKRLIWCEGKSRSGPAMSWREFIDEISSRGEI